MAIMIKIKPVRITASTKSDVIKKITGQSIWATSHRDSFYSNGRFLVKEATNTVRLYNLEKHNRKMKITKRTITRGKRKGEVEVLREVLKTSHWVAHYYDIPRDMIDEKNTRQHNRNFTVRIKGNGHG